MHAPVVRAGLCMAADPSTRRVVGVCLTAACAHAAAGVGTSQAASFQGSPLELSYWVSHNLPLQVCCRCPPPPLDGAAQLALRTSVLQPQPYASQSQQRAVAAQAARFSCGQAFSVSCLCLFVHAAALHAPAAADVLLPCRPAEAAAGAAAASRQAVLQRLWHTAGHHSRCAGNDNRGHRGHIRQQPRVSPVGTLAGLCVCCLEPSTRTWLQMLQ